jgi:sirohydrochlorin ferrochelatase
MLQVQLPERYEREELLGMPLTVSEHPPVLHLILRNSEEKGAKQREQMRANLCQLDGGVKSAGVVEQIKGCAWQLWVTCNG